MSHDSSETVSVSVTRNSASLALGTISIALAVLALLVSRIPFWGFIAIPGAAVAILLALVGLCIAFAKGMRGVTMPLLGGILATLAIALPIGSTTATSAGITSAMDESNRIEGAKIDKALAGLILEDLEWTVDRTYDKPRLLVSYKLRNSSDTRIATVTTRVNFLAVDGSELAQQLESPVSRLDSDMSPGNVVAKEGNMFEYPDVPAELVNSVSVEIIEIEVK